MHEFSICRGLVDAVLSELEALDPPPLRVREVRVVAGAMHQLVPEFLETAYAVLTRDTAADGSRLRLVVRPVSVTCAACAWNGMIEPPFFQCRQCGSSDISIQSGNELYLDRLTIDEPDVERRQTG